ncbi:uncharacterized protein LOC119732303 [Patiria miniata]|uniref:Uncharacterized protein n=1 Tax=Patiria miniata TaxID=46514 RepID=A0A914ACN8_PATMI|nr:uncharacterized protein LOC119732303 [Patiria miniata]
MVTRKRKVRKSKKEAFQSVLLAARPCQESIPPKSDVSNTSTEDQECSLPPCQKRKIQLFVISSSTSPVCLQLHPSTTISALKGLLQDKVGIEPEKQHLFTRRNCELRDDLSLGNYGIEQDTNIELRLVSGLMGGADKQKTTGERKTNKKRRKSGKTSSSSEDILRESNSDEEGQVRSTDGSVDSPTTTSDQSTGKRKRRRRRRQKHAKMEPSCDEAKISTSLDQDDTGDSQTCTSTAGVSASNFDKLDLFLWILCLPLITIHVILSIWSPRMIQVTSSSKDGINGRTSSGAREKKHSDDSGHSSTSAAKPGRKRTRSRRQRKARQKLSLDEAERQTTLNDDKRDHSDVPADSYTSAGKPGKIQRRGITKKNSRKRTKHQKVAKKSLSAEEAIDKTSKDDKADDKLVNSRDSTVSSSAKTTAKRNNQSKGRKKTKKQTNADKKPSCEEKKDSQIQLFVISSLRSPVCLQLHPSTTISALKGLLQDKLGIEPKKQHLYTRKNHELKGRMSLKELGIQQDTNIELRLVSGLIGGADDEQKSAGDSPERTDNDSGRRQKGKRKATKRRTSRGGEENADNSDDTSISSAVKAPTGQSSGETQEQKPEPPREKNDSATKRKGKRKDANRRTSRGGEETMDNTKDSGHPSWEQQKQKQEMPMKENVSGRRQKGKRRATKTGTSRQGTNSDNLQDSSISSAVNAPAGHPSGERQEQKLEQPMKEHDSGRRRKGKRKAIKTGTSRGSEENSDDLEDSSISSAVNAPAGHPSGERQEQKLEQPMKEHDFRRRRKGKRKATKTGTSRGSEENSDNLEDSSISAVNAPAGHPSGERQEQKLEQPMKEHDSGRRQKGKRKATKTGTSRGSEENSDNLEDSSISAVNAPAGHSSGETQEQKQEQPRKDDIGRVQKGKRKAVNKSPSEVETDAKSQDNTKQEILHDPGNSCSSAAVGTSASTLSETVARTRKTRERQETAGGEAEESQQKTVASGKQQVDTGSSPASTSVTTSSGSRSKGRTRRRRKKRKNPEKNPEDGDSQVLDLDRLQPEDQNVADVMELNMQQGKGTALEQQRPKDQKTEEKDNHKALSSSETQSMDRERDYGPDRFKADDLGRHQKEMTSPEHPLRCKQDDGPDRSPQFKNQEARSQNAKEEPVKQSCQQRLTVPERHAVRQEQIIETERPQQEPGVGERGFQQVSEASPGQLGHELSSHQGIATRENQGVRQKQASHHAQKERDDDLYGPDPNIQSTVGEQCPQEEVMTPVQDKSQSDRLRKGNLSPEQLQGGTENVQHPLKQQPEVRSQSVQTSQDTSPDTVTSRTDVDSPSLQTSQDTSPATDAAADAAADLCEEALKKVYKTTGSYVQMIPWVDDDMMHIMDIYTKLRLVTDELEMICKGYEDGEEVTYEGAFLIKNEDGVVINRIIYEGLAGLGKTTLIGKIAHDWATISSGPLAKYKLVFVLRMSALEQTTDLIDSLYEQLIDPNIINKNDLKTFIFKNPKKVLILLDGFDELMTTKLDNKSFGSILQILNRKVGADIDVVITTRTSHFGTLVSRSLVGKPFTHVKVMGFLEEDVENYLGNFFSRSHHDAETLFQTIKSSGVLFDLAHSPMLLLLMCLLWRQDSRLPNTISRLYGKAQKYIFKRKGIPEEEIPKILVAIGKVAFHGLVSPVQRLSFQDREFEKYVLDKALKAGILTSQRVLIGLDTHNNIQFIHKTIQEFCAAVYLQSLQKSDADEFQKNLNELDDMENFHYLLRFCCGDNEACTIKVLQMLQKRINDERRLTCTQRTENTALNMALNCYFESQAENILSEAFINSVITETIHTKDLKSHDDVNSFVWFLKHVANQAKYTGNIYLDKVKGLYFNHHSLERCTEDLAFAIYNMPNISVVRLSGCSLTTKSMTEIASSLSKADKLTELDLSHNEALRGFVHSWMPLLNKMHLRILKLDGCLTVDDIKHIALTLSDMPNLMELSETGLSEIGHLRINPLGCGIMLDLHGMSLNGTEMKLILKALVNRKDLVALYMSQIEGLQGTAALWTSQFKELKQLDRLNFEMCKLTSTDVQLIVASLYDTPTLTQLLLSGNYNYCSKDDVKCIASLIGRLTKLTLCKVNQWFQVSPRGTGLEIKLLSRMFTSADVVDIVNAMSSRSDIVQVVTDDVKGLGGTAAEWSPTLRELKFLEQLHIRNCSLTGTDIEIIAASLNSEAIAAALSDIPTLVELDLSGNFMLAGSGAWSHLKRLKQLKKLVLKECWLCDADIEPITASLSDIPTLVELDLSGNEDLSGLDAWSHLKGLKQLKKLSLRECSLRDADIQHIAASLGDIQTLVELDLSGNEDLSCSDEWSHLKGLKQLKKLSLGGCSLSDVDIERIAASLSSVVVESTTCESGF